MIMKSYCEHYSDSPPKYHSGKAHSLSHEKYHKLWQNHGSELLFKLTKFSRVMLSVAVAMYFCETELQCLLTCFCFCFR